jgi:NAD(P)-dependent dehydrogenase (short-subunit alcohol dehydrogenase family)
MVAERGPCRKARFGRIFAPGEQRRRMTDTSVFAPGLFAGRHILITGGATGIGFGIAEELGRLGARVTIASRDTARLDAAVTRLHAAGIDAKARQLNIRDNAAVEAIFADLASADDLPDALVNNAGGQFSAPALETSASGFRAILDLNLQGTWQMCRAYGAALVAAKKPGRIVNIVFAHCGAMPDFAAAAAARAGMVNLTRTLALEWGRHSILVNAIGPGTIATEALGQYENAEEWRRAVAKQPVPRLGTPRDVALAAAYLLSPAGDFVTGTLLRVDGGETLLARDAES